MTEEDFESKKHVTKHLTLGRYGKTEEATRVNSWPELDYLNWKMFLARTLVPENVTPRGLRTICDASDKYRKAYRSYSFGLVQGVKKGWVIIMVVGMVALFVFLYFSGIFPRA